MSQMPSQIWQRVTWRGREVWSRKSCEAYSCFPSKTERAIEAYYNSQRNGTNNIRTARNKHEAKHYLQTLKLCMYIQAWWRGSCGRRVANEQRLLVLNDKSSTKERQLGNSNNSCESIQDALVGRHLQLVQSFQTPDIHNPHPLKYTHEWWLPIQATTSKTTFERESNKNFVLCDINVYERTSPDGFYALLFEAWPKKRRQRQRMNVPDKIQPSARVVGVAELETLLAPLFRKERKSNPHFRSEDTRRVELRLWDAEQATRYEAEFHVADRGGKLDEWARRGGTIRRRELVKWVLRRMCLRYPKPGSHTLILSVTSAAACTGAFTQQIGPTEQVYR